MTRISIVTICLNSEKTISKTIQSVLNQSVKPFEYIIIDGGSTDSTISIAKALTKKTTFPVKIYSEPDEGISDAFNKGISKTQGDWVHILNSDDFYIDDTVLPRMTNQIEKNTEKDIILGGIIEESPNGFTKAKFAYLIDESLKWGMTVLHPATIVKKSVFECVGLFDTTFKVAMDYEWLIRFEKVCGMKRTVLVQEVFTHFSVGGVSSKRKAEGFREVAKAQLMHTDLNRLNVAYRYILNKFFYCNWLGKRIQRYSKVLRKELTKQTGTTQKKQMAELRKS